MKIGDIYIGPLSGKLLKVEEIIGDNEFRGKIIYEGMAKGELGQEGYFDLSIVEKDWKKL